MAGEFHRIKFAEETKVQTEQSLTQAIGLFEKSCDLEMAKGCAMAGSLQVKGTNGVEVRTVGFDDSYFLTFFSALSTEKSRQSCKAF